MVGARYIPSQGGRGGAWFTFPGQWVPLQSSEDYTWQHLTSWPRLWPSGPMDTVTIDVKPDGVGVYGQYHTVLPYLAVRFHRIYRCGLLLRPAVFGGHYLPCRTGKRCRPIPVACCTPVGRLLQFPPLSPLVLRSIPFACRLPPVGCGFLPLLHVYRPVDLSAWIAWPLFGGRLR